jgi:hypothetical protein
MKMILALTGILAAALMAVEVLYAEDVSGNLTTVDEKPVHKALVVVHDTSGNFVDVSNTDRSGTFTFENLKPGTYRITVYSPRQGTPPQRTAVTVESGKASTVNLTFGHRGPYREAGLLPF